MGYCSSWVSKLLLQVSSLYSLKLSTASIVPYRSFKTKDGAILLGGGNDRLFGILCDGLGRPAWKDDGRYATNAQRVAHRDVLEREIEALTAERTTVKWLDIFEGRGVPYAAVNDVKTTLEHEHTLARDMVVDMDHEHCGRITMVNTPLKLSDSKPRVRTAPPVLGQHTDEILTEQLGLSGSDISELRKKSIIR
jgi:succinate---hydroxymethylglutarate CoA-transferase